MSKPEPLATPPSHEELRLQRLRALYPELDTEGGRVDPQRLAGLIPGDSLDPGPERYGLSWNGKRAAQQALALGPTGALRPCPEESLDWETTRNVFIEGENLETLRIMLKPYFRKVKMIYIDPPYNTGGDFIYKDNYTAPVADYLKKTGQADEAGNLLVSNPESSGRYHSDWLTMMYPRLALARELLREDGVLFCSIDDHEVHNLRLLLNEVFGEENFVAAIAWERADSPRMDADYFSTKHEYVLCCARNLAAFRVIRSEYEGEEVPDHYNRVDGHGRRYYLKPLRAMGGQGETREARPNLYYAISAPDGSEVFPKLEDGRDGAWRWGQEKLARERARIEWTGSASEWTPYYRIYADESHGRPPETMVFAKDVGSNRTATAELKALFDEGRPFDAPKPVGLLKHLVSMACDPESLVLDFFSGSATTAHALIDLNNADGGNRRYILVQLPEPTEREDYPTIADIGKERIRRVAARIREERAGQLDLEQRETPLDLGMRVFKLGASSLADNRHEATTEGRPDQDGDYAAALQGSLDTLLPDWRPEDLLWEVLLREGLPLDCRIETLTAGPQTVYRATDPDTDGDGAERRLYVCLDDAVSDEPLVALLGEDRNARLVCRESALADDSVAQNLALHCRLVTL